MSGPGPVVAPSVDVEREGLHALAALLAKVIEELLGTDFFDAFPSHPGAVAFRTLTETPWHAGSPKNEDVLRMGKQLEDYLNLALAFSELFPGATQLTLGDVTAFAGPGYAAQLRSRARDPEDFKSVISEVWIANTLQRAGFQIEPIQRPEGKQADFSARAPDGTRMQIECKIAQVDASVTSLKGKLENANRQFKADPEGRPGVLVVHLVDSQLPRTMGAEREAPLTVRKVQEEFARVLAGAKYRSISLVAFIWDDVWERPDRSQGIIKRVRSWGVEVMKHPHARVNLARDTFPVNLGATMLTEIVVAVPLCATAFGPYSVRHRFPVRLR